MPNEPVPCRVYADLARSAPVGGVIRRGPSDWVQQLRWNLEEDIFEPGQWLRGRVDADDFHLSPNGRYLVYQASKKGNHRFGGQEPHPLVDWTAISRPPFFTALMLWEHDGRGSHAHFVTDQEVLIGAFSVPQFPAAGEPPPAEMQFVPLERGREEYIARQQLISTFYGWHDTEANVPDYFPRGADYLGKGLPKHSAKRDTSGGRFDLIRSIIGYGGNNPGFVQQAFGVRDRSKDSVLWLPVGTDWADWDCRQRLVWSQGGRIWAFHFASNRRTDLDKAEMLIDLNANRPAGIISPEWARHW